MSEHKVSVKWARNSTDFGYKNYNRDHVWRFDSGVEVPASAAPAYWGNPQRVDPEAAFVAALSSCHMLTFLYVASRKGFAITEYVDEAVGTMTKNAEGTPWISAVVLRPRIAWAGDKRPTPEEEHALHEAAHQSGLAGADCPVGRTCCPTSSSERQKIILYDRKVK